MIKILKTSIISPLSISISLSAANVLYTVAFLVKSQVWWLFFEFFPWLLCHRKSTVFTSRRNIVSDGVFLTDDGKLLHVRVEATGKARSPSVERLVDGTTRIAVSAERIRRRVSRRQMSGEGAQQGTAGLFHEDSGRPECTVGM